MALLNLNKLLRLGRLSGAIIIAKLRGSMLAISLTTMIRARDKNLKALALTTLVAQVLGGAGESMMFGIMFRYKVKF